MKLEYLGKPRLGRMGLARPAVRRGRPSLASCVAWATRGPGIGVLVGRPALWSIRANRGPSSEVRAEEGEVGG